MKTILKFIERHRLLSPFSNQKFIGLTILCLLSFSLLGQSFLQLELNYQNLAQTLQKEQTKLDSLNSVYKKMVSTIDKEKQKVAADKNTITTMLAEAVVVSNDLKTQQNKVDIIENELESVKKTLNTTYAAKIDSIELLEKSNSYTGDLVNLRSLKMQYIEKRLLVSPKIYSLSFDPQKLIQYNPAGSYDSLEQKIYLEYLTNALKEINNQSQQLAILKNEIEEVIYLQNETADFIDDVNSEMMFNPALQSTQTTEKSAAVFSGGYSNRLDEDVSNIYSQANSYLNIFNQLKTITAMDEESLWQTPTDTIPANFTFQQYLNLLQDVDKMLQDYRVLLVHKLKVY
jgi:hypothetical protein